MSENCFLTTENPLSSLTLTFQAWVRGLMDRGGVYSVSVAVYPWTAAEQPGAARSGRLDLCMCRCVELPERLSAGSL
mgnify:CR=1 FL=1